MRWAGRTIALVAAAALLAAAVRAQLIVDPRIALIDYDPGQVTIVRAAAGYAVVVELGSEEAIDTVVVGDSASWQVTANKRGDHVVIKPLAAAAATDMVVVTGTRTYVFLLDPGGTAVNTPFVVRFRYPQSAATAPAPVIAAYRFRGARALFPVAMFDDGQHTTVTWGKDTLLPAVYAVGSDGKERIVNGHFRGVDYVVDEVAPRFVLRADKQTATATRQPLKRVR
jgi:type IV secretion system protein VirB9